MHAPLVRLVLGLLVAATTQLPVPAAAATTEQRYPVPASGQWEVDGRGWGHGIGMSQWGAQGAAQQGLNHEEILAFYYPGTTRNVVGNRTVRVALSAHSPTLTATIWAPPGQTFTIATVGQAAQVKGAGRYTVTRDGDGYRIERRDRIDGAVRETFRLAGTEIEFRTGDGVVIASDQTSTDGTWYRGSLRLVGSVDVATAFDVVNHVPLEDYLRGVVPRESPSGWNLEALKAQAVAARSYVLTEHKAPHFDTCDTTSCQVYGGRATIISDGETTQTPVSKEATSTDRAVQDTAGQVRWYDGAVAFTQFSSTNGGYSVTGSKPYLVARPDPYTGTAAGDSRTTWTGTLKASTVAQQCPDKGRLEALVVTRRDGNGPMGGRVTGARLECTTGDRTLTSATTLRFGLFSPWWRPKEPPYGFFLSNTFGSVADVVFTYGRPDEVAYVGDWDGDGTDTVALRRGATFYVRNSNSAGDSDTVFTYGREGDTILVGDWDGDGTDTLAVRRGSVYHVRNSTTSGPADQIVAYGRAEDAVVVGDWDDNGTDTLAVRRGAQYFIKNTIAAGDADQVVVYGRPDDAVLVGDWDGNGADTLGIHRKP